MSHNHFIKILVVDDHPLVRRGLASLIAQEEDLRVCGEAESVPDALEQIEKTKPDLALIDLTLKGSDGLDLIKKIHQHWPDILSLVVSMHEESVYAERALKAGAMGYVMKAEADQQILAAIRSVLDHRIYISESIKEKILQRLARGVHDPQEAFLEQLSDREIEVYQLTGEGLDTRQISERLCICVKTVECYRARIKSKLKLRSGTELIQHATKWVMKRKD